MSLLIEALRIVDHHLGDLGVLGVFGFGALEQRLEGQQSGLDGEDGRPGAAEGVETDGALARRVRQLRKTNADSEWGDGQTGTGMDVRFGC